MTSIAFWSSHRGMVLYGTNGAIIFLSIFSVFAIGLSLAALNWRTSSAMQRICYMGILGLALSFLFFPQSLISGHDRMRQDAIVDARIKQIRNALSSDDRFRHIDVAYARSGSPGHSPMLGTLYLTGEVAEPFLVDLRTTITNDPMGFQLDVEGDNYVFITWNVVVRKNDNIKSGVR
ncbi:hypothetical protein [Stieleria varia]|uniref:hypothetical protein n=1 Tax=Stieleria varia TaxID=2528005 RepID=UPI0011B51109|nr:hypothetical protein [Stieleria varia]